MSKAPERSKNWEGAGKHFDVSVFQHAWESVHDIHVLWIVNGVCVFSKSQLHRGVATPGSGAATGERSVCVGWRGKEAIQMFFSYKNIRN